MGTSFSQINENQDLVSFRKLFAQKFHFVSELSDQTFGMLQIFKQNLTTGEIEIMDQLEYIAVQSKWSKENQALTQFRESAKLLKDIQHPNLLKLYIINEAHGDNFCGDFDKISLYYEYYPRTLQKEMQLKQKQNCKYSEQELLIFLYALTSAFNCLDENYLYQYNQVDPSHIFVTEKHVIKVATFLKTTNQVIKQKRNLNQYLSPQQLQGLKFPSLALENQSKSIVFQIGMIILSLTILKPLYFCYDYVNCKINFEYIHNILKQMPGHSYSPFLCSLLQNMLQENDNYRPAFNQILTTIRPYIQQAYFQDDFLKDLPQQIPQQMFLPHSPLRLKKNLSNVQLLQKSILKSESKAMLNDSTKQRDRSPLINNSVNLKIQTKPKLMQSFQGSTYSTDLKTQSYMQNPSQLSSMGNQQQPYFQQVCQTRSIQNNSKIIQKENQFTRSRQNTSFYCSPGQQQQQTITLTTPISPISKATQRIILTPLSRSPLQQQSMQHQNELNISDQMFCSPTLPKQVRFFQQQQSPYMHKQVSPNILQQKSLNQKVVRKIPQQPQLVQRQVVERVDEQNGQNNLLNETGSNKETISNNEKNSNNNEQGSNIEIGSNSEKDSKNENNSNHTYQSQKEDNQENDILNTDKSEMNVKNINLRNAIFDKITEVSKEIENNTETEKRSEESQQFQNSDQEISQEWQLVDHQEEDLEQPNYIEIIEQKIKQALRNSQQTISKVQGQQQPSATTQLRPQEQQQQYKEINYIQFQRKKPMQCVQYRQQQAPIAYNQTPVQQFPVNAPSPHNYYRTHSPSNINICYRPQQVLQKQRQFI